jgi:uncharacterized protein YjbI with pentapeptide repeats
LQKRKTKAPVWVCGILLVVLLSVGVVSGGVWWWASITKQRYENANKGKITPTEQLEIEKNTLDAAIKILQTMGALGFFFTAYVSWKSLQNTEDKQITERFSKAVELLSETDKLEARIGGILILDRIARDSPKDNWTVLEVLSAYIREHSTTERSKSTSNGDDLEHKEPVVITVDIQTALTVIHQCNVANDGKATLNLREANLHKADLKGVNLRGANLRGANLNEADLRGANLDEADLRGANLNEANLWDASLRGANLHKADLNGVVLWNASLRGANLNEAQIRTIYLRGTDLRESNLTKANLRGANLSEAKLRGIDLSKADLRGVDLSKADLRKSNLSKADLREANLSEADLRGANLSEAKLFRAKLFRANLSKANLIEFVFWDASPSSIGFDPFQEIKSARNWQTALYSPKFRQNLELDSEL